MHALRGMGDAVVQAIYWQYRPAAADDTIPPTLEGQLLGIADRMATIVDMFALGLEPTGSKDPFALRRAANGVIRILAESGLPLRLSELERLATSPEQNALAETTTSSVTALLPRAVGFLSEGSHGLQLRREQSRAGRRFRRYRRHNCSRQGRDGGASDGCSRPGRFRGHLRGVQENPEHPAAGAGQGRRIRHSGSCRRLSGTRRTSALR